MVLVVLFQDVTKHSSSFTACDLKTHLSQYRAGLATWRWRVTPVSLRSPEGTSPS